LAAGSEAPRHFWKLTTGQKAMSPLRFATADRKFQRLFYFPALTKHVPGEYLN
jgi:hypothetical protein